MKENINPANFSKLLLDLAKHLLLLKNQIPLQFEAIAKEVELDDKNLLAGALEETEDAKTENQRGPSRRDVRERRQKLRERKGKERLLKNGRKLLEDFSSLAESLQSELEEGGEDVVSLSFLFGATAHSAREVYTVEVPRYAAGGGGGGGGHGLQLFRAMLGHQDLGKVTGRRLPVSNMFTVISRRRSAAPLVSSSSLPQSDYSLPSPARCPRVTFTFQQPELENCQTTIRRLRFTSGAESEPCLIQPPDFSSTPAVARQVVSMELCTPAQAQAQAPASCRMEVMEVMEAMEGSSPALQLVSQSDSMELCTPLPASLPGLAGQRRRQELDLTSLSLLSPDKRSRRTTAGSETEEVSLQWAILETAIRGFKI